MSLQEENSEISRNRIKLLWNCWAAAAQAIILSCSRTRARWGRIYVRVDIIIYLCYTAPGSVLSCPVFISNLIIIVRELWPCPKQTHTAQDQGSRDEYRCKIHMSHTPAPPPPHPHKNVRPRSESEFNPQSQWTVKWHEERERTYKYNHSMLKHCLLKSRI